MQSDNRQVQAPSSSFGQIAYPPELPITGRKDEIVSAIQAHPVIVLSGETGSGKTTQIPKMCLEAGLGQRRKIACTQPRRVAALSVARRVAEELGVNFGAEVGAKIRFADQTSARTRIKFMTDGMLLSEAQADPMLRGYDAIIVDEAHERSLNIDFLLGHLNQLRHKRPDLKIVIASATIDTEKFSQAFGGAPIIEVSGRVYPVDVIYAPLDELLEESGDFTYLEGIAESTQRIQEEFGAGDILAFLPTEKDIREAMELLEGRFGRRMEIVPCFGRLSNADQQRIFQTTTKRKLVLATNIAETSLTIPGIRFVIDTGLARISRYNPRSRTRRLPIVKVSQASANQRKGRCGRVADGICIRLYSESDFESRPLHSVPEIQRANLAEVILRMLAARLGEVERFPFIDPPSPAAIKDGYDLLEELGAIDARRRLMPLGRQLAKLPVDPTVGRMLIEAERHGVVEQVLVIASALSIQDPRERPMDKEAAARQAHARFNHRDSDFLSLLNIWEALHDELEKLSQGRLRKFCKSHFLSYLRVREWRDVYEQLRRALKDSSPSSSSPSTSSSTLSASPSSPAEKESARALDGAEYQAIHASLLAGLLANAGRREEANLYRCPGDRKPLVFPGSALFIRQATDKKGKRPEPAAQAAPRKKGPEWIMAAEIVETSRLYARTVAAIDPDWLLEVGAHLITRSYSDPIFVPEEGRVVARESIRLHGLEIRNSKVSYLKVDPQKATDIFIREALLNEEFEAPGNWTFLEPNRKLMRRIQNAHTVISVAHWMGVEEAAFRFYRSRLTGVASIHDLNRELKRAGPAESPLAMREADLASEEAAVDLSQFPESVELENSALPIEYHYQRGHEKDGVTLKLPYQSAKSIDAALLDWLVPGHLEAKIHALIKALPKDLRQRLVPLADAAKAIARDLKPTRATLVASLADHLRTAYSLETYASDWDESAIPPHLRVRVEVHDRKGQPLAEGRDLAAVQSQLAAKEAEVSRAPDDDTAALWRRARERFERPIGSLADLESAADAHSLDAIRIGDRHGIPVRAYVALRTPAAPSQSAHSKSPNPFPSLRLALFRSPEDAALANRSGIADLLELELSRELAWIEADLRDVERLGPLGVAFRPMPLLKQDVFEHIRQAIRAHDLDTLEIGEVRNAVEAARAKSKGILYRVVDQAKSILERRQELILRPGVAKEFGSEIERLLPPDFLRRAPHEILARIPVYLACIEKRLTKRGNDPARDAQRGKDLQRYRERYSQLAARARSDPRDPSARLRWMIEEFAISLFAQELGTAQPVSAKKLDQAFAELEAGAPGPTGASPSASPEKPAAPAADRPTQADLDSLKKLFR